jgi:hypothetical protein
MKMKHSVPPKATSHNPLQASLSKCLSINVSTVAVPCIFWFRIEPLCGRFPWSVFSRCGVFNFLALSCGPFPPVFHLHESLPLIRPWTISCWLFECADTNGDPLFTQCILKLERDEKRTNAFLSFLLLYAQTSGVPHFKTVASHPLSCPIGLRAVNFFSNRETWQACVTMCRAVCPPFTSFARPRPISSLQFCNSVSEFLNRGT